MGYFYHNFIYMTLTDTIAAIKIRDFPTAENGLHAVFESMLRDYIIEKGFWGDDKKVIFEITGQTILALIEKIEEGCNPTAANPNAASPSEDRLAKTAKQICNDRINKYLKEQSGVKNIKELLKLNIDDDDKLTRIIRAKLAEMDKVAGTDFADKLLRHEKQMQKFGLTIQDANYIEKAFVTLSRKGNSNLIIISECQYLFALYFGYNVSHKEIAEFEERHLLKIEDERKSIERLRNCLKRIFEFAKELKDGNGK